MPDFLLYALSAGLMLALVAVICLILFFVGRQLFSVFGITLDSFRV